MRERGVDREREIERDRSSDKGGLNEGQVLLFQSMHEQECVL